VVAAVAYVKVAEGLPGIETGSSPPSAPAAAAPYWSGTVPPSEAGVNDSYPTETSCATGTVAFSRHRAWPDAGTLSIGSQYDAVQGLDASWQHSSTPSHRLD
jgi:hypothetical protein